MKRILDFLVMVFSSISELIEECCVDKDDKNSYRYQSSYKFKKY